MEQRLQQVLTNRTVKRIRDAGRALSAVLLPVYRKEDGYYLMFTKRTQQVKEHKGQISFPGGVYQDEDGTLLNTALRECDEEVGLAPEKVRILGELDDFITQTSSYIISPFVGVIPYPYDFRVSEQEIEEIIEVPVSALLAKDCLNEETKITNGEPVVARSYHYRGRVIWGTTATILYQFLGIVTQILKKNQG